MDEYAEFIYQRKPEIRDANIGKHFAKLNQRLTECHFDHTGDISKQLELRKRLKCNSFDWFMKEVAFDQEKYYPKVEPRDFASGFVQSAQHPDLCVDNNVRNRNESTPM